MTIDERVARLEERDRMQNARLSSMEAKIDRLLEAASMGKGAWLALLKVGGIIVALASAGAWIWDHLNK